MSSQGAAITNRGGVPLKLKKLLNVQGVVFLYQGLYTSNKELSLCNFKYLAFVKCKVRGEVVVLLYKGVDAPIRVVPLGFFH